ncbi:MAG: hypothetical protein GX321_00195 [Clostridiales bacterium]|nr:hypothetical protein [Clostridiales bacterium]
MKDHNIDELLRESLTQIEGPSYELNQSIKNSIEEHIMQKNVRKLIPIPLLVILLTLLMSFSVYAAWKILSPEEIAQELGDKGLAIAFQSEDATVINETICSGGYNISFLGIVSGKDLSDFKGSAHEIYPNRTYAVVAIAKEDGSPMPSTSDDEYGETPFFISPLIKGEKPWWCNIVTMNGSYSELVADGIMYRLIECDDIEIFADRELYLCVSSTPFYSKEAYNYNEETGDISPNLEFDGINILFDLPLDPSKADPEKAEKYLQDLYSDDNSDTELDKSNFNSSNFNNVDSNNSDSINVDSSDFDIFDIIENGTIADLNVPEYLDALMEVSILIPESVKEVSYTDEGLMVYEHDGYRVVCGEDWIFPEEYIGMSDVKGLSGGGEKGIRFSRYNRDENGVISGMRYQVQINK